MSGYVDTRLWRSHLASREGDEYEAARDRLRSAYLLFRERAAILAAEIPQDLRSFTVHDVTHLDALWETADLVAGDIQLTPAEAFVLGGAFLIHDLGMGLAAYPGGLAELQKHPSWRDVAYGAAERILGCAPRSDQELGQLPDHVLAEAKSEALRLLHAERAQVLALIEWQSSTGNTYRLLDDQPLRDTYGPLIGKIGSSHWWPVAALSKEFTAEIGAQVDLPPTWTVRPLLLAALLRAADASHVDARRAPGLTMAVRAPQGVAALHWTFQNYLQRAQIQDDRLVYTSTHSFRVDEAEAWWLCLDTLRMVDGELRAVDALLADHHLPRFEARSVAGVDDPDRLARLIPTDGWIPVDASVRVADVARLIETLGGRELYGDRPEVAVRELLQNAADAVRARRRLEPEDAEYAGRITVRLRAEAQGSVIEVSDNGVGMSERVLTGPLLDFGRSLWGSEMMRSEFPNLLSTGYQSAGKYGIGFFAAFMLGARCDVVSRRYDGAASDTFILSFTGLRARPILRRASRSECLPQPGTTVRIWLEHDVASDAGLYSSAYDPRTASLSDLITYLAPALDVDIYVKDGDADATRVIEAADWLALTPEELFDRVVDPKFTRGEFDYTSVAKADFAKRVADVTALDGKVQGRAAMTVYGIGLGRGYFRPGVLVIAGLRAAEIHGLSGILTGRPDRASRDCGAPVVSWDEVALWAADQAEKVNTAYELDEYAQLEVAEAAISLGAFLADAPIALTGNGPCRTADIADMATRHEELIVASSRRFGVYHNDTGMFVARAVRSGLEKISLAPNVILFDENTIYVLGSGGGGAASWPLFPEPDLGEIVGVDERVAAFWRHEAHQVPGHIVRAIADGWRCPLNRVLAAMHLGGSRDEAEVGVADNGHAVCVDAIILHRPSGEKDG